VGYLFTNISQERVSFDLSIDAASTLLPSTGVYEVSLVRNGAYSLLQPSVTLPVSIGLALEPLDVVLLGVQPPHPEIQVFPTVLDFGYVPPGSFKELPLEVKNIGTATLTGTVSAFVPFSIVSGENYSLEPNQSQQVVVRFTSPLQEGSQTSSLLFTGGGGSLVEVRGTNKKVLLWLPLLLKD
jgi:hypothetical protein